MKLPIRLENAITKLYTAYHSNTLNAFDCRACAVGNICDGSDMWADYFGHNVVRTKNDKVIGVYENSEALIPYFKNGYNQNELHMVENLFLKEFIGIVGKKDKEMEFKGLCAVVEYLCELDNIPNVMDYTKLFETENNEPKYQLNTTKSC